MTKNTTARRVLIALTTAAVAALAACNTVEGVGKDVKAGGKALENAAAGAK